MNRATKDANERERQSTDGWSRFFKSGACRPIPLTERAVQVKLARKVHGRRRSKKNLEGLYEVLAPGSNIPNVSPITFNINEPGKAILTLRNSETAKFGTLQERQTPLKVYADGRGSRNSEKLIEERIQSQNKELTRKIKVTRR